MTTHTREYEVVDIDGTVVSFTHDPQGRNVAGFIPATGGSTGHRLLHPQYAAAMQAARSTGASDRVLALCADMDEPEGIRSDDSRPRWPAMLTHVGPVVAR